MIFILKDASYSEIVDIVERLRKELHSETHPLKEVYFLWHPRTEYDFLKSQNNTFASPLPFADTDIISKVNGVIIHSYINRSCEEKKLLALINYDWYVEAKIGKSY